MEDREKEPPLAIEIRNPELESILEQRLKAGKFESIEDMLLQTFRAPQTRYEEQQIVGPELPVWHLGSVGEFHRRDIYDDLS